MPGEDFVTSVSDSTIRFAPYSATAELILTPKDDEKLEPNEIVKLVLAKSEGYWLSLPYGNAEAERRVNQDGLELFRTIADDDVRIVLVAGRGQGNSSTVAPGAGIVDVKDFLTQAAEDQPNLQSAGITPDEVRTVSSVNGRNWPIERPLEDAILSGLHAVRNRPLPLALAGYSQGGGAMYDVMNRFADREERSARTLFALKTTAYINAIRHQPFNPIPQQHAPKLGGYHLNFYQGGHDGGFPANFPHGDSNPGAFNVDLDVDNHPFWTNSVAFRGKSLIGLAHVGQEGDPFQYFGNRFVHASSVTDDWGDKQVIHRHQPVTYFIAKTILERWA